MPELALFTQSSESRSKAYAAEKIRNFYAEIGSSGAKSPLNLFGRPGLTEFTTVGDGPIRGIHTMEGVPFVVSGTDVFRFNSTGVVVNLGTIGGTDVVDMADNGTEVCIVTEDKGFIVTTTASSAAQITDVDFRTPESVTFQDGFFLFHEKDTDTIFRSELLDGFSYDALDFATAEYKSDNLVKMFSDRDELLAMGVNTTEFWYDAGTDGLAFEPIQGKVWEVGCLARDSVKILDNTVFFLGSDDRGGRTVFKAGQGPRRISNHYVERRLDASDNPASARAFTFRIEGHAFYVLTIPSELTVVYDASNNLWYDWDTEGVNDWSTIGFSNAHNRRYTGDSTSNKIYTISLDVLTDDGNFFTSEAVSQKVDSPNNQLARHNFFRIDMEAGVGLESGQGVDPMIELTWADEDGENFVDFKQMSMGKIGETKKRAYRRRLGLSRSRTYKIRITDPVKRSISGTYLAVAPGIYT